MTTPFFVSYGICRGGPHNGRPHAEQNAKRWAPSDGAEGFYVFRPASGTTPGEWKWIAKGSKA